MSEMEKLVEDIRDYLISWYAKGQHDRELGIGRTEIITRWMETDAKKIITRIGKAFRDGNLDEAWGVVGRIPLKKLLKSPYDPDKVVWDWVSDLSLLIDTDILIAFRLEKREERQ